MKLYQTLLKKAKQGFKELNYANQSKDIALSNIKIWLYEDMFNIYLPHLIHLINLENWELLIDSFCKIIPFGTGGRRGLVGIGPNRINLCTIKISAQGYSQYLMKQFGNLARKRGIVLAYDVREFILNGFETVNSMNPLTKSIQSNNLAKAAASVYTANGIKVYLFNSPKSTPVLSFSIRYLNAIGGCIFTASHNSPQYNGEKFYDHLGSQLIPPYDEIISYEINKKTNKILELNTNVAKNKGLIKYLNKNIDQHYYNEVKAVTLNNSRNIKILYSPLHGTGLTSVLPVLLQLGFDVKLDKATSNLSGYFENVIFNSPNPELKQSFDTLTKNAELLGSDIIINTDPDADRLGLMVYHKNSWIFFNGNQIATILAKYALTNFKHSKLLINSLLIIKTIVTTSLITEISNSYNAQCIDNLLVGFKYISSTINKINLCSKKGYFLLGLEESHGYLVGSYCRDKDASGTAVWISELAAMLKNDGRTLVDYLNTIYSTYGYCHNYLTEIILLGIKGINQINYIMKYFRLKNTFNLGELNISKKIDLWETSPQPHLSKSDTNSRNIIILLIQNLDITKNITLTLRPSGTEPKLKIYIEVFSLPFNINNIDQIKSKIINIRKIIEKNFLKLCYNILNLTLSDRSFLLFNQIPLYDKLKYFEIENKIVLLANIKSNKVKRNKLNKLLYFLGTNPINKVDPAFSKKYGTSIINYLKLN